MLVSKVRFLTSSSLSSLLAFLLTASDAVEELPSSAQIADVSLASADFQKPQLFDPENIDPSNLNAPGPSTNIPNDQGAGANAPISQTSPHPIQPTNIHLRPFPPAVDKNSLKAITYTVNGYATAIIAGLGVIWFFAAWRSGGWIGTIWISQLVGALAVAVFLAHGLVVRKIEKELDRIRLQMHQDRGEQHSPPTPESVEWLNSFVKVFVNLPLLFPSAAQLTLSFHSVWPLINPEMFTSLVDMIGSSSVFNFSFVVAF
jgi:hypothetical protein